MTSSKQNSLVGALACAALAASSPAGAQTFSEVQDRTGNTSCPAFGDWATRLLFNDTNHNNWGDVGTLPLKKVFIPATNRAGMTIKRLVMFGDMGAMNRDKTPSVSDELRQLLGKADLVLGNIEAPITTNPFPLTSGADSTQSVNFHVSTGYLRSFMTQHCIDPKKAVFSVANNHANDNDHWVDTLANVCASSEWGLFSGTTCKPTAALGGAQFVGVDFAPKESAAIRAIDVGGMRIGVAAWTHVQNTRPKRDFWTGEVLPPTWEGSLDVVGSDFRVRKSLLGVQFLIGLPHWDCQFNDYPHPETISAAHSLANGGFDLIAGAHPSVVQPANMVGGAGQSLAFYSLGGTGSPLVTPNPPQSVVFAEVLVNSAGKLLEYQLHHFVERVAPATTMLLAEPACPGSRPFTDTPRLTDREIVPFQTAWNDAVQKGDTKAQDALLKSSRRLETLFH